MPLHLMQTWLTLSFQEHIIYSKILENRGWKLSSSEFKYPKNILINQGFQFKSESGLVKYTGSMYFSKQQVDGLAELLCSRAADLQDCQLLSLLNSFGTRLSRSAGGPMSRPECCSVPVCRWKGKKKKKSSSPDTSREWRGNYTSTHTHRNAHDAYSFPPLRSGSPAEAVW